MYLGQGGLQFFSDRRHLDVKIILCALYYRYNATGSKKQGLGDKGEDPRLIARQAGESEEAQFLKKS